LKAYLAMTLITAIVFAAVGIVLLIWASPLSVRYNTKHVSLARRVKPYLFHPALPVFGENLKVCAARIGERTC
jgi:hypothetical protein